jgi:hypothetical protein
MVTRRTGVGDLEVKISDLWKLVLTTAPIVGLFVTGWMNLNSTLTTLKNNDAVQTEAIAKQAHDIEDLKTSVSDVKTILQRHGTIINRMAYKLKVPLDTEPRQYSCFPNCDAIGKKHTLFGIPEPPEPPVAGQNSHALFDAPEPIAKKEPPAPQMSGDYDSVTRIEQENIR